MTIKALYPSIRPTIDLRFAQSQRLGELVTFSRASSATRVNERGDIEIVPAGQPRFEHNYNTFELEGLLIESFSATNLITHSVPVVPSGGGLPDGWVQDQLQPGITYATVGSGIEKGLSYVDIQFSGTTTGANRTLIRPGNSFAVTSGQSFIASVYAKIISGVVPSGARCDWSPANGGVNIGQTPRALWNIELMDRLIQAQEHVSLVLILVQWVVGLLLILAFGWLLLNLLINHNRLIALLFLPMELLPREVPT